MINFSLKNMTYLLLEAYYIEHSMCSSQRNKMNSAGKTDGVSLYQLLFVDNQLKLQSQLFCRFAAQDHALHKDFKLLHNGSILGINGQLLLDQGFLFVDFQRRFLD